MKFKCPKCGTLIEGQPERCPSCGVKFKWKKPEEAKPNPEKPVSPAPTANPRSDIALMMVVKPAMAKYRELYPEDVIDDEEVELYMVNPKAPCFIKNPEETYIYLILPVNFTTVS